MRSLSFCGLAFLIVYSFCMFKANAHPEKVDYHSAICQKMQMIAAGGAGGGTTPGLMYGALGVTAVGGDFSIVCPLIYVTGSDVTSTDDAPPGSTVTLTLTAKVTSTSTASACELRSESTLFISVPTFPLGSGTISGSASVVLPSTTAGNPNGLHFTCTPLKQNTQLGSIQIQVQP